VGLLIVLEKSAGRRLIVESERGSRGKQKGGAVDGRGRKKKGKDWRDDSIENIAGGEGQEMR